MISTIHFFINSTHMMAIKKSLFPQLLCLVFFATSSITSFAQNLKIYNDDQKKQVVFGNENLTFKLDYAQKASITELNVNGRRVVQSGAGMYSLIRTATSFYSSLHTAVEPTLKTTANTVTLSGIKYGDNDLTINETWVFTISKTDISFDIDRTLSNAVTAEKIGFPVISFNSPETWEGAFTDYGGLAWFYLFNRPQDTYGVHTASSRFWSSKFDNGLTIDVSAPGRQVAMDYSRTLNNRLNCTVAVTSAEMTPRFDAGTNRRRYVRDTTDVWAPCALAAGKSSQRITFTAFEFNKKFGRGELVGVNQEQVSAVLNTIARIGVIDKKHFGGNSWHTPYGPICLHEQYIAQMGLAINDKAYLTGYQECLDFYRDNAIQPDGRVWPRWAYTNEDAMPGIFTDKGFYEAQWGYLLDSNPDFVTNVSELYDQTGDIQWVKTHQQACEKALDWMIKRDENKNGLVEMMTDNHQQKRGSDWIDIIWAAYENAFVNAKLYRALSLWADIEGQLGNTQKATFYADFAQKLKTSFNKPTTAGGFWDEEKKCYIHWRDKDGSPHGNNMVIPVNFMAVSYGICDDKNRTATILDIIENQMVKENLFTWPICLYTYSPGEGNDWQFPFPNYENGDIFLSWGATGVDAYAAYKPELAVKYVKNVLAQYAKDGLAFQRYGRAAQDGRGDDILSGNCLSVVGLYQSVYGINPKYNRFYLNPHITPELAGTTVKYNFRDQQLAVQLNMERYAVSNEQHKITAPNDFGFFSKPGALQYFHKNADRASLEVKSDAKSLLEIVVRKWSSDEMSFVRLPQNAAIGKTVYQVNGLTPNTFYTIQSNNTTLKQANTNSNGTLVFEGKAITSTEEIVILRK